MKKTSFAVSVQMASQMLHKTPKMLDPIEMNMKMMQIA
jgi:hypothetical protein